MPKTRFTEADVERAGAGARKAGIEVSAIEIRPDGTILVTARSPARYDQPEEPVEDVRSLL